MLRHYIIYKQQLTSGCVIVPISIPRIRVSTVRRVKVTALAAFAAFAVIS